MKTTRETSSSPGFTKNSMYVIPSRGSSTRVAFTAFLEEEGARGGDAQGHRPPQDGAGASGLVNRTGSGGGGWQVPGRPETGELGFQEGLQGLGGDPGSEARLSEAPMGGGSRTNYLY